MSNTLKRHNLHTHTTFSDGRVSPFQIVQGAAAEGLEIIGISDHAFSLKMDPREQISKGLNEYIDELLPLKKNAKNIEVLIGIEIDASLNTGTDPKKLPFDILNLFDYILFESVNTDFEAWGRVGRRDISEIIEIRDNLSIPVGLAHNDVQRNFEGREEYIAGVLAENNIFIELNDSNSSRNTRDGEDYFLHFSEKLVKCLKDMDVKIVIGSDSHDGFGLNDLDVAYNFALKHNLSFHPMVT